MTVAPGPVRRTHGWIFALLGAGVLLAGGGLLVHRTRDAETHRQVLLEAGIRDWEDPSRREEVTNSLRRFNPEWDFMHRTFLVLALAEVALADPARKEDHLALMDGILADTQARIEKAGQRWYLMSYVDRAPFRDPSGRSLFVDGEVGLMLGARRLVAEDPRHADLHRRLNQEMVAQFARSPALLPESYPDEAWVFCNTNALVSIRMGNVLDGDPPDPLIARWVDHARSALVEPSSGMMGSEYTWDGRMMDGPEGSSIWLVATNLLLLDEDLARAQYQKARSALYGSILGLGYAREWGPDWQGPRDVDSGPLVPGLEASASSSGFALLAARAFGDAQTFDALVRSMGMALDLARVVPGFEELADNAVGNAVLLRGLTFGPLWEAVRRRGGGEG